MYPGLHWQMSVFLHVPWAGLVQLLTFWHVAKEVNHNHKHNCSNNAFAPLPPPPKSLRRRLIPLKESSKNITPLSLILEVY